MATELKIRDTRNFRCDLFGCKNQAVKAITTVTAPVSECFMICQEHLDMLITKLGIKQVADPSVLPDVHPKEPVEEVIEKVPEPKRYLTVPKHKTNEELEQEAHEEEIKKQEEQAAQTRKKAGTSRTERSNVFEKR